MRHMFRIFRSKLLGEGSTSPGRGRGGFTEKVVLEIILERYEEFVR